MGGVQVIQAGVVGAITAPHFGQTHPVGMATGFGLLVVIRAALAGFMAYFPSGRLSSPASARTAARSSMWMQSHMQA